jgi:hypothetical protein
LLSLLAVSQRKAKESKEKTCNTNAVSAWSTSGGGKRKTGKERQKWSTVATPTPCLFAVSWKKVREIRKNNEI